MLGSNDVGRRLTALLIGLFIALSAGAVMFWRSEKMHAITGDEPHYLVIADGLLPTFELEQSGPYSREFRNRTIVESGLAARDAVPSPANTHAETGPHGLFNVHNIGLPVILAVPYLLGGEVGARLTMVFFGACIVLLLGKVTSLTKLEPRQQFLVTLPVALGLPFVTGATQIYPDLPGGAICLAAVYALLREPTPGRARDGILTAILLAYLPWLHIRFALPMAILLTALVFAWRHQSTVIRTALKFGSPAVLSVLLLATYNWYAFGHVTGPYQSGDVMLNRIAIMQFLGLLFDQNQGIALQQPLYFVGFFYAVRLLRKHTLGLVAALVTALAMIGPNATHWNLYGGWSFSGRFGWGVATVLAPFVLLSLSTLVSDNSRAGLAIVSLGLLVQIRHIIAVFIQKRVLFPHTFDGWIGTYSTFWGPIEKYLPQWRDMRWAFGFVPNMVFLSVAIGFVVIGAVSSIDMRARKFLVASLVVPAVLTLVMYGRFADLPFPRERWAASVLPGITGQVDNLSRIAEPGDKKDLLTFGPFWEVPEGDYEIGVRYFSGGSDSPNGMLDVYFSDAGIVDQIVELNPTSAEGREIFFPLHVTSGHAGKLEIRTLYEGTGTLRVDWIQLRRVTGNTPE